MKTKWIRTCQECGYKFQDSKPVYGEEPTNTWKNRKCKKCGSEAFDYGSERHFTDDGKEIEDLDEYLLSLKSNVIVQEKDNPKDED